MSTHHPRKRFGQHFLRDQAVIRQIVDTFAPRAEETIAEIGPGDGALTRALLQRVPTLHAVELDRDLVNALRAAYPPSQLALHQADALEYDFCKLATGGAKLRLVGNLPYNISTPLLFHLLDGVDCIADMLFMLQKEVVDRMAAAPATSDYGRLSVMIQYRLRVEPLWHVPPTAFHPAPKVDSAVVRLVPHAVPPVQPRNPATFALVVKAAFANRRKMLRNNLKDVITRDRLAALDIDPTRRAETLTLQEFARIADAVAASG